LKGVFFDGRGYIVATDGSVAFAAKCGECTALGNTWADGIGTDGLAGVIVPLDAVAQVIKGKSGPIDLERDANGLWWLKRGAVSVHFKPVEGNFPSWHRIIPELPETLVAAHYAPHYVNALGNMAKALRDGKKGDAVNFRIMQNGENPALVLFPAVRHKSSDPEGARGDVCAVVMPMRGVDVSGFNRAAFV